MTEREALKELIKQGYSMICQSNDWNDPWDNGKTGEEFEGCSGHPGCQEAVWEFEKVWEEAIRSLGLDPKDMATKEFKKWIDAA
jgi:hypothetical protein